MKSFNFAIAAILAASTFAVPYAAHAQQMMSGVHRTDLSKNNLDIPGYEEIQSRVDIAPGATAPNHKHPGEEIIYVIQGTIEYRLEGRQPVTLKAGDVLFIPTGVPHSAKNVGTTDAAELGTYVVPIGKPLVVLVK